MNIQAFRPVGAPILLAALVLVASGCANRSLTAHQCQADDWRTVGYSDGFRGLPQTRLLDHQNACGRHGIVPDATQYRAGWDQGVREFCEPDRGYDLGVAGRAFPAVCPAGQREAFRAAWDAGRELYLARSEVARLENLIYRYEQRIESIGTELITAGAEQIDPTLTAEERVALLARSKALLEERDRLRDELPELAADLDIAQIELARMEQTLAARS